MAVSGRDLPQGLGRAQLRNAALLATALIVSACTGPEARESASRESAPLTALRRADVVWLDRATFGLDTATLAEYRRLGRERFLDAQLHPRGDRLPPSIATQVQSIEDSLTPPAERLLAVRDRRKLADVLAQPSDQAEARKAINEEGNRLAYQAVRLQLLRAVYSPAQVREQMVWFWLNHFSVYQYKGDVRWLLADYEERAIRPNALGRFRDLLLATLEHPAMLQYLDNAQNALNHANENYARELLELHTLGVDGGYTQQDVQQLARVLTGFGLNTGPDPHLRQELKQFYVRHGAFEFNPARHDFGAKLLLGERIDGAGFGEAERAVTLITHQPACARFIARQLASYYVGDTPPPRLVEAMASAFERSDGDIAQVLRAMFLAPEFVAAQAGKFKDPMRYVVSAVRLAYDGRPISNARPLLDWLNALGEGPFNRQTPDGYPLAGAGWQSPGQMSRRFEIARAIGSGNVHLFDSEEGTPASVGFPQLSNRLYFEAIEPFLADSTRTALAQASSPQEWGAFLLASPEMNYE